MNHRDGLTSLAKQSGSVAILTIVLLIPAFLLLVLCVVTVQQTIKKQELQMAADAAALAAATTVARGMNTIVTSNKGMADVLSVMISVRAVRDTAPVMAATASSMAGAAYASQLYPLAEILRQEAFAWAAFAADASRVDSYLSNPVTGFGWQSMRNLDFLNQSIKAVIPISLEASALHYAKTNGASGAFAVNGSPNVLPRIPLGRGGKEFIAAYATQCSLEATDSLSRLLLFGGCAKHALRPCITSLISIGVHKGFQQQIVYSLGGSETPPPQFGVIESSEVGSARSEEPGSSSVEDRIAEENRNRRKADPNSKDVDVRQLLKPRSYKSFSSMQWPTDAPLPMMLTSDALAVPSWIIPNPRAPINANKIRSDLEFLVLSIGPSPKIQMGSEWFKQGLDGKLLTYAQAEVFNPQDWYMFDQNWRARLSRASLLEEKFALLISKSGLPLEAVTKEALRALNYH
jgi:Putative Flp pilus-assembly TadE/G-like